MTAESLPASPLLEDELRRGLFGRIFKRKKRDESGLDDVFSVNQTKIILNETLVDEPPAPLTWIETFFGKSETVVVEEEATIEEAVVPPSTEVFVGSAVAEEANILYGVEGAELLDGVEDVDLPPIVQVSPQQKGRPVIATANLPLALVVCMLLLRAAWYFNQHKKKVTTAEEAHTTTRSVPHTNGKSIANGNGTKTNGSNGHVAAEVKKSPISPEVEEELKRILDREAIAKKKLVQENQTLQQALDQHKSSVDKFSVEMQARNERLSVFEQEQGNVRRQLSSQIEVLKHELQDRHKQEQGNLESKGSLCHDLITKIKALNKDLENHENIWQGVAQKAEQKEVESAAKVETLQKAMKVEEEQRIAAVKTKEEACADLTTKMQALQAQHARQKQKNALLEERMGTGIFSAVSEKLRSRLEEEQAHASSLTTRLQVFSAELLSREERVSTLDAKMKDVERMSASELKQLQQELQDHVVQREKLQQADVEMTRLLQEKQNQCVRLQGQWESSKSELQVLEERVQTLTTEVEKRETTAATRFEALQAQLEEERKQQEACQKTSEETNEDLIKKQEEFIQLTTRMDLFLKELQFRDDQVASLESKLTAKEDLATSEIKALQSQLQEVKERRDTWNKTTDDLNQLMKDKKAQVVGLTTRADLFELELTNRQEGVDALDAKIKKRQEVESVKMEPYRKELHCIEEDHDAWRAKTEDIGHLLKQRIAESQGLTTRLRLFRVELAKRDERLSVLKTTYEDKKQSATLDVAPVRAKLEQQREQRDAWTTKTQDIDRTLQEKRAQCVGLKTRVHLFEKELETKESAVAELEAVVADKEEAGDAVATRLKQKLDKQVKGRDDWKVSTKKVIQLLADKKDEAAGLTAELKGLVGDLQNYQQRRAKLEAQIVQQRSLYGTRREAMEGELKVAQGYCDTWVDKTKEVTQALKAMEQSIVGLETRAMLFEKELAQRGELANQLQKEYWAMERKSSMKLEQLRGAIIVEKNLQEHGVDTTVKLNKELKNTKREWLGLTTRSELFTRELQKRVDLVSEQQKRINDAEDEASVVLEHLREAVSEQEKARDEWSDKKIEVDRLQADNDEKIISLGTSLEAAMGQVMKEEGNVAQAEKKVRSQRSLTPNSFLTKEFDAAKENRDVWTARALEMEQELKTRKSQVAGLKTRKLLFRRELDRLEEQVSSLKQKVAEKETLSSEKVAPLKEALKRFQRQQDDWRANLECINEKLNEKQRQCLPISKRLEEVIDQLTQCKKRIDILEGQHQDEESFRETEVKGLKSRLDQQKKEHAAWKKNTADVHRLLQAKREGTEGLKTRLHVFGEELRKRQEAADGVKSKICENDQALTDELDLINAQIEAKHLERDQIIETTLAKNQSLKAMEDTCAAVAVRRRLFEDELRSREEQATILKAKHKEKEYDHTGEMKRLKSELAARRSDRDKWRDSTQSMETLWKETEHQCVGLATRSQLFNIEKEKFEKQVADLENTVCCKETDSAEKIGPIHDQLQQEQQERDAWDKKTIELDGKLQENRREVVGLNTRSKLFIQELQQKETGVATLSAKIKEEEEDFGERMKPLLREYNAVKEDRDKWEKSTANVNALLERTKVEVASIPTRLNLFRREQETRAVALAELEESIRNKENLVAVQLGFLLNELQLQQKQRGKWKKVTLEMHRLLKETKDEVGTLTNKLESANKKRQEHEEQVMSLAAMLRDTRDLTDQQLFILKSEVERQSKQRDEFRASTAVLNRLLEEAKEQCKDLSGKLSVSETQIQSCTTAVESLEAKVTEKKALDASQVESIKAQLKIHLGQRAEWRENTNQMKQRLKEKQLLCTTLKTKLVLLKNLQSGEVRSSLSTDEPDAAMPGAVGGISAHFENITQMAGNVGNKSEAEEKLTNRMDSLENELRKQEEDENKLSNSTQQLEQGLKEKESQCAELAGQLTSIQKQCNSANAPCLDVDRMLAEKEKKQANLNSRLESLAGELLAL